MRMLLPDDSPAARYSGLSVALSLTHAGIRFRPLKFSGFLVGTARQRKQLVIYYL
jgi:hypothetical protein